MPDQITQPWTPSKPCIDLIKETEGLRLVPYKDQAGVWTVGYGHTTAAGPPEVRPGSPITKEQAESILVSDIIMCYKQFKKNVTVALTHNQIGAMVSFIFNIGIGNFLKSSVFYYLKSNDLEKIPERMRLWNKVGGVYNQGLANRREKEIKLWLS